MPARMHSWPMTIQIQAPGTQYKGQRFDQTSMVVSAFHADLGELLSGERPDINSLEGWGLCCEFDLKSPPGYHQCKPGGWFAKIGQGAIRKPDDKPYRFDRAWPEVHPASWRILSQGPDHWHVRMSCTESEAPPWILERRYSLHGPQLRCETTLKNPGTQVLETEEYCHNFIRWPQDHSPLDLEVSWDPQGPHEEYVDPRGVLTPSPGHVRLDAREGGEPPVEYYLSHLSRRLPPGSRWTLHAPWGPMVSEHLPTGGGHASLWGRAHVVTPEMFCPISVPPGQSVTWTRTWTFGPADSTIETQP